MKLQPLAFGLSLGIWLSVGLLSLSVINHLTGLWGEGIAVFGSLYLGYDSTIKGTLIGMALSFIDFFIAGYLVAWLYNKLAK